MPFDNNNTIDVPWSCTFGTDVNNPDWCGIDQDDTDVDEFIPGTGTTPTVGTGPEDDGDHGRTAATFCSNQLVFYVKE